MKKQLAFPIITLCTIASLNAASTFLPNATTFQHNGGSINTSSIGLLNNHAAEFEVGTNNQSLSFRSQAARGNLDALVTPTFINTSIVANTPTGTFDLILRTADLDADPLAEATATQKKTFNRHKIRSNGDTNSITFTQTFSQAWSVSRRFINSPFTTGNLNWGLAQIVDWGTQDSSIVAIDAKFFDENFIPIDLTSAEFSSLANGQGNANAASFSQAGTTATMIYAAGAGNNTAGMNLRDFDNTNIIGTSTVINDFIGKVEYTFRTTNGTNFASGVAFQYTTNGGIYSNSPVVVPEPTATALIGFGALSLVLRRRR